MWKWLKRLLLAAVVALTVFIVNGVWFKPFSIRVFYERVFLEFALESPELLTSLHLLEGLGIRGHNAKLDDRSQQAADRQLANLKLNLDMLHSYGTGGMTEDEKLSYDMLDCFLSEQVAGADKFRYHSYPVNQLFGVQGELPKFMVNNHQLNDEQDAEMYVQRLNEFKRVLGEVVTDMNIRAQKGVVPPRFVLEKVKEQVDGLVKGPVEEQLLYKHFVDSIGKIDSIPAEKKTQLVASAKQAMEQSVNPGYQQLSGYLADNISRATTDDGVWKLPDGDAYYAYMLRQHTTTDLTPEQIHQLGLSEVARIQAQMKEILHAQGVQGDDVAVMMKQLGDDNRFLYPDTKEAREQILKDYDVILKDITARLDPAFRLRPKAPMEVRRVPEFAEKTSPGAYYEAPAMDGSRPGVFYANLYDIKATPKFSMKTLAVHEGIPGHHFQIAIQQELQGVPTFRKLLPFTVYAEGWALYTERLMAELGLYKDDPYSDLGRLQDELFRAIRLVVDTGIHYKRWTREEAIAYMSNNSGIAASDVQSEIERYIVMPGQACAYKIGMLKLLELREKAKAELGDKFNLQDYHDVVLKNGSMPIAILERVVNRDIAEKKAQ